MVRARIVLVSLAAATVGCSSGAGLLRDYARALESQRRGDTTEARRLYGEILAARSDFEGVHNNLALMELDAGQLDTALEELRRERAARPELTTAQLNEVIIVLRREGRGAARPMAEALVEAAAPALPDPVAYLLLGICHRSDGGDLARAEAALDEAVQHGVGQARLVALTERGAVRARAGRPAEGAADFAAVAALRPDAVASYNEALLRLRAADKDGAQRAADRASAIDPEAVPVRRLAAVLAAALGDHEDALEQLDAILVKDANDSDALWRRGLSLLALGRPKDAAAALSAARQPGSPPSLHFDHAVTLVGAGELEAARDAFQRATGVPGAQENARALNELLGR